MDRGRKWGIQKGRPGVWATPGQAPSLPEFFYVVVALAVAILLITLAITYFGVFNQSKETSVTGNKIKVAREIAGYAEKCWEEHRYGMDSESAICKTIDMDAEEVVTEYDVTEFLNCDVFPNNECEDADCSFCESEKFNQSNRLEWDVSSQKAEIQIAYSGSKRIIEIEEV